MKPALYPAAGIPGYLRVDLGGDGLEAAVYRLAGGRHVVSARVLSGDRLSLTEPFPVELDLVAATTRGRS